LKITPNDSQIQQLIKRFKEIGKSGEEPVVFSPGTSKEHKEMADFFLKSEKYQEAIVELYYALDLDPKNLYLNYQLGIIFEKLGWYEDALWKYEEVLARFPEQKEVLDHYNIVRFKLGR
jgi:tetratricopeptide (TPR) repeat protein